jgi:drug/metabolite transporter (DMT)-like permease
VLAWSVYGPPVLDFRVTYWAGLAYLGIVASALVFSLYFPLVRTIGPGKAAYIGLITPMIAMLLSSIWENYQWTLAAACGGLLVLAGLFMALRPAAKPS